MTYARIALFVLVSAAVPAGTATAQTTTPPDVVRLHDGTFLRGTIVERSPAQVVIMLPTGEARTYPADQVEFAGPEAPAVPPVPVPPVMPIVPSYQPPQPPSVPMARLHVRSAQQGLSLQQLSGTASVAIAMSRGGVGYAQIDQFSVVCVAPCDTEIPAGTYQLGVAPGAGSALRAGPPVNLQGDMNLELSYEDRSALRIIGWVQFIVGFGGGTALATASVLVGPQIDVGMLVSGAVIAGASTIAFFVLTFLQDAPRIDFDPTVRF